jgi:hypothetical protein
MRRIHLILGAVVLVALVGTVAVNHGPGTDGIETAHAEAPSFRSYGARMIDAGTFVPTEPLFAVLAPFESGLVPGVPPS